jgi:hypothetical protein
MKKIKKIIALIIFLLGTVAVANAFYPGADEKLKDLFLKPFLKTEEQGENKEKQTETNILGEETQKEFENFQEEAVGQLKDLPNKILSQETVTELKETVNQVIIEKVVEKVEESKDIPQKGVDQVKEEIRKQLYQEICGEWLKED